MNEKKFGYAVITKENVGESVVLAMVGDYVPDPTQDFKVWFQLKINYVMKDNPKLISCNLRFGPGFESCWEDIYFKRNKPVRAETSSLLGGNKSIDMDYFRNKYGPMMEFIPQDEPIRPVLEKLVR